MQYSGEKQSQIQFTSNTTSDIYVSKGSTSDPNNFVYDASFMGVKSLTIDADALGLNDSGYAWAVYVAAVDEAAN